MMKPNPTSRLNFEKARKRHLNDSDHICFNLDFKAPVEEVSVVLELARISCWHISTFELPDSEEYDFFTDFIWFSKKLIDSISNTCIDPLPLSFSTTAREMSAAQYVLSKGMEIAARHDPLSSDFADKAILTESFRRRLIKNTQTNL